MKSYKVVEFGKPLQKVEESNPAPQGSEVLVRITAAGVTPWIRLAAPTVASATSRSWPLPTGGSAPAWRTARPPDWGIA